MELLGILLRYSDDKLRAARRLTNAETDEESADYTGLRPALLLDFLAA
jgi:hypothetical protein